MQEKQKNQRPAAAGGWSHVHGAVSVEHVAMFRRALVRPVYDGSHELVGFSCSLGF